MIHKIQIADKQAMVPSVLKHENVKDCILQTILCLGQEMSLNDPQYGEKQRQNRDILQYD